MVRPEPHQPLDEADLGAERGVEPRLGLLEEELPRQRQDRIALGRGIAVAGVRLHGRRHARLGRAFCAASLLRFAIALLGLSLGIEFDRPRDWRRALVCSSAAAISPASGRSSSASRRRADRRRSPRSFRPRPQAKPVQRQCGFSF